jgi:hypothetical protein
MSSVQYVLPEPSTMTLLCTGLVFVMGRHRAARTKSCDRVTIADGPFLRLAREVKLSALRAIPTTSRTRSPFVFNHLGMAGFLH